MNTTPVADAASKQMPRIAVFGLLTNGLLYVLMGLFVLLQIFNLYTGGNDREAVLQEMKRSVAGRWLLPIIAVGLFSFAVWQLVEAVRNIRLKHWGKAVVILINGLVFGLFAWSAVTLFLNTRGSHEGPERRIARELLQMPFGQWWAGFAAVILIGIGAYQVYFGLSGKYKMHVSKMSLATPHHTLLLLIGRVGYTARGIVSVLIGYLMWRAAVSGSSRKAGDAGMALRFAENEWGAVVLGVIAVGLIAFGIFNFVRAKYDRLY